MTKASDNIFPRFLVSEGGSTATPAAGQVTVYAKANGLLYSKDDAGVESLMSSAGSGSVATDAIWDAAGDLVQGTGANTAAKLTIGSTADILRVAAGAAAWQAGPVAGTASRTAGSYTTTSATFEDVDATNMKVTLTTGAHRCLVGFTGMCYDSNAGQSIYFDIDLDGSRLSNQANGIVSYVEPATPDWHPVMFTWLTDALSAASHIFKLQWRCSANTANLYGAGSAWPCRLWVVEQMV